MTGWTAAEDAGVDCDGDRSAGPVRALDCGGCRSAGPVPATFLEATPSASAASPGPDRAALTFRLQGGGGGDDRIAFGELSLDDLREATVGNPGADLDGRRLFLVRRELVDGLLLRARRPATPSSPAGSTSTARGLADLARHRSRSSSLAEV